MSETRSTLTLFCSILRRLPRPSRTVMFCRLTESVKSTDTSAMSAPNRIISSSRIARNDRPSAAYAIASNRFVFPCAFSPHRTFTPSSNATSARAMFRKFSSAMELQSMEDLGEDLGALPRTPLKNFLKEVFKNFKNFNQGGS